MAGTSIQSWGGIGLVPPHGKVFGVHDGRQLLMQQMAKVWWVANYTTSLNEKRGGGQRVSYRKWKGFFPFPILLWCYRFPGWPHHGWASGVKRPRGFTMKAYQQFVHSDRGFLILDLDWTSKNKPLNDSAALQQLGQMIRWLAVAGQDGVGPWWKSEYRAAGYVREKWSAIYAGLTGDPFLFYFNKENHFFFC